jgi:drug/metabolite transporter (DMT)-like permease
MPRSVPTATATAAATAPATSTTPLRGIVLCVVSATAFGVAAAIAAEAAAAGVSLTSMLTGRFLIAAAVFALIARLRGARLSSRLVLTAVGLGGAGYALQASLYFGALLHADATLVALLLYVYPALVVALAAALGRERLDRRVLLALGCSLAGLVLLLGGGVSGGGSALGLGMALGAAVVYALYITVAAGVLARGDLFAVSAVICASAGTAIGIGGAVSGTLALPSGAGLVWITLLALISTVTAVGCFFAGMQAIGASKASVLSCVEPVVTSLVAVALYGEVLTPARVAGGLAVLGAVLIVQSRGLRAPGRPFPLPEPVDA